MPLRKKEQNDDDKSENSVQNMIRLFGGSKNDQVADNQSNTSEPFKGIGKRLDVESASARSSLGNAFLKTINDRAKRALNKTKSGRKNIFAGMRNSGSRDGGSVNSETRKIGKNIMDSSRFKNAIKFRPDLSEVENF